MGGVIQFPGAGMRGETERLQAREDAPQASRSAMHLSVIETVTSRDDDDGDGGSAA